MIRKILKIFLILILLWVCVLTVYSDCHQLLPYCYDMHDGRFDMFHKSKFLLHIISLLWFLFVSIYLIWTLIRSFRHFYKPSSNE